MKKMNNKGFSLVELIIVIAIMAILAGALAPALVKYINKSRKSADISNAQSIASAANAAMADDAAISKLGSSAVTVTIDGTTIGGTADAAIKTAVQNNLSGSYKIKYGKANDTKFTVTITPGGGDKVDIAVSAGTDGLYPTPSGNYSN